MVEQTTAAARALLQEVGTVALRVERFDLGGEAPAAGGAEPWAAGRANIQPFERRRHAN